MIDKYPKFLPTWTKAIENVHKSKICNEAAYTELRDNHKLNYMNSECCLTGEAFFNKGAPTMDCETCSHMTYEGAYAVLGNKFGLYMFKQLLAEHLQEHHPVIWEQWKNRI